MSGLDPQKPNLVFSLSPVKSLYIDKLKSLCDARLNITGAIVRHDAEASLQDYYKYDYVALGGRPVRKRKKRLNQKKNRKRCTIQIEITNNDMEINHEWELIIAFSARHGDRRRRSKRRYPFQISYLLDRYAGIRPKFQP